MMKNRSQLLTVVAVSLLLLGVLGSNGLSQENVSSGRGFGLGVAISLTPWPFISYVFSDRVGMQATGVLLPGVVAISASLDYRFLDNKSLDFLASSGLVVLISGLLNPLEGTFVSGGASLEYSFSRNLAVLASVGLSTPLSGLGGVQPSYGLSVVYYF